MKSKETTKIEMTTYMNPAGKGKGKQAYDQRKHHANVKAHDSDVEKERIRETATEKRDRAYLEKKRSGGALE